MGVEVTPTPPLTEVTTVVCGTPLKELAEVTTKFSGLFDAESSKREDDSSDLAAASGSEEAARGKVGVLVVVRG